MVATGTGSGKSFAFGIPIVSTALRLRDQGVRGIKALIVYPMNALANSQYDDFARRLHGTGLRIALYTGDTFYSPAEALEQYRRVTGRAQPYDSEVLSREEIQRNPPDILMTNYVMLELLLTRFEDRRLFAAPGVLRFLVMDEVHTYTGKRGADVAALIRRLKQHTGTAGHLRCIATSATVESTRDVSAAEAVADFAQKLFGEPFWPDDVVTETYEPLPDDLPPLTRTVADALSEGPKTIPQLAQDLNVAPASIQQALLQSPSSTFQPPTSNIQPPVPKLHAFFSQGRAITACLDAAGPHLNDRGERICPVCAQAGDERPTFPMVFCRACGQEFYSVAVDEGGHLHPAELDAVDVPGQSGYLYPGRWDPDEIPLPETWLTDRGNIRSRYREFVPQPHSLCPTCGRLGGDCDHPRREVTFVPVPFLLCPSCGIVHDRRPREFNKLFTFGSVGRSTATDVLVSAQVQNLPEGGRKVIAFSDNRQDTALQAAHMNSLHNRFAFRRALYHTLLEGEATVESREWMELPVVGLRIFETMHRHGVLPEFHSGRRMFGRDRQSEARYQRYLQFVALRELQATHRRTHQNLEDVGLLDVGYHGLEECAAHEPFWADAPILADLDSDTRYDLLLGFLHLMRKRLAVAHEAALRPNTFQTEVLDRLDEAAHVHDDTFSGPIGYSDEAPRWRSYLSYRLTASNTQPVTWVKRVLGVDHATAADLVGRIVAKLGDERAAFLVQHTVHGPRRARYDLWMVNPEILTLQADEAPAHWVCPRCLTVHRFQSLRVCTGSTCRTTLQERSLEGNYFRQVYTLPLGEAVPVRAEEHSGQVSGQERREIELHFRDPDDPLNALICTPTMELGIDIGHLNAVTMRNVPPSPSHYAQRAGRAGRSGQPSLISVFAGVGFARGPHDQYFYRFPEKMIAGAIVAPRFRLDNRDLIWTHIHSLVLETMGLKGVERLPGKPRDLLNLDQEAFPLYTDWEATYRAGIERYFADIVAAVEEAFAEEIARFDWFDRPFVERTVRGFVDDLDRAMNRWRMEYRRLDEEREELNRLLGREGVDPGLNRRRVVVEGKLQAMREGEGNWYLYRYLGGEGFLPGYAFPPQATVISFDDREDELARDPAIALTEYAPGNFVYYRGQRYEVTHARPRTRQMQPDVEPVEVCPTCERAYLGPQEARRAVCLCGQDLSGVHPRRALPLSDMYARRRARITADEEERLRLGYEVTKHYMASGQPTTYRVSADGVPAFHLTLEHGGRVLLLNRGARQREAEPRGFTLCSKCHRWLMTEEAEQKHIGTPTKRGECPRNAQAEDLIRGLWLMQTIQSDLALLDVPLPDGMEAEPFYTTFLHTWLRALMVTFNLDENEMDGFLAPGWEAEVPYRLALYETTVGGSGVLASLAEQGRLRMAVARARELLHEGDPEGGCERACYDCLLSFYNQRDHELLDRQLVLPFLQSLEGAVTEHVAGEDEAERFERLLSQCQSSFEREVLHAIRDAELRLPDEAQKTVYDGDESIATSDFFYAPRLLVFVDGSPHYRDYVQAADEHRRHRLRALGYRILAITPEDIDERLEELAGRLR
ncbi:MAG: DEAD/DEAH box helicase [Anaerolineales bacterium]|nr:DEAD/DEAH box helicase [Anaerolineales bacterium]